jgi:hypothetical protein
MPSTPLLNHGNNRCTSMLCGPPVMLLVRAAMSPLPCQQLHVCAMSNCAMYTLLIAQGV